MTTKIKSTSLEDNAVTTAKIASDAVTAAKIPANAVGSSELDLTASYTFTGTVSGAGTIEKISSAAAASGASPFTVDLPTTAGKYSRLLWNIRGVRMSTAHGFGLRFRTSGGSVRNDGDSGSRTSGDYWAYNFEEMQGSAVTGEDNPTTNGVRAYYYNLPLTDDDAKYFVNYEFVICNNEVSTLSTAVQYTAYGGADYSGTNYYCWRRGMGGVQTAEVNDQMKIVMFNYAQNTYTATMTHEGWELYGILK